MNIQQLESYNLADAVKFHDTLNPLLWDQRENLHPEIQEQLMAIAADFGEFLGVKDLDLKDITMSGSNAAYSYTPHSDIDLHLIVDLSNAEHEDVYRELFTAKKSIYNKENTITIKGIPVEVYVQDATQEHYSQGIYSILNNKWIQIPRRIRAEIDDISVRSKYQDFSKRIKKVIKSNDAEQMNELMDKIKQMREIGLAEKGEFGPENLVFKLLKNTGDLKKLQAARQAAKNQELSLKERVHNSTKYGYGRDYIEEVELTPDGTSPTTAQFTNETQDNHKNIIQDFVEFCSSQLDLEKNINLRIRRDPQWSVRNKTFGRYNPGTNELEVGIGGRHIMDVLRTVGHELVHQKQNELHSVPADAGADGSRYENEANAMAGVLMRQYGKLHPELFANSSSVPTDIAEGKEQITWVKPNFEFEWHEVEEQSKITYELTRLKQGMAEGLNEASGYIPTAAEADDPRFEMALTVDVHPGALGKAANSFLLNTNSQGHPQELRPDGLVKRMAEELAMFKTGNMLFENTDAVIAHGYAYNRRNQRESWTKEFANEAAAIEWARRRNATLSSIVPKQKLSENAAQHIPSVLYHATYKPRLKSIKLKGLGAGGKRNWEDSQRGVVYLALDPNVAESYAETSDMVPDEWLDSIVILKIATAGLDPNKFHIDRNVQDNAGDTVEYHGIIPPSNISLYTKDEELNESNHLHGFLTRIETESPLWEIEMMVDPYIKIKISASSAAAAILKMKKRWPGLDQIPNTQFIVRSIKQYKESK
jgi:hypothetical protein